MQLSKCSREGKQPLVKQQSLCSLTTQFDTPLSQNRWRCWGTDQFLTVCTWLPWEASRLFSCVTPVSFLWMLRHDSTFMYSVFANILNSDAHRNILFGEYNINLIVGPQTEWLKANESSSSWRNIILFFIHVKLNMAYDPLIIFDAMNFDKLFV